MYTDHVRPTSGSLARLESSSSPDIGTVAPDFEWTEEDGSRTRLSDLRGKLVLLAFFAGPWNPARPYQLHVYHEVLQRLPEGGRVLGLAQDGAWCEIMLDDRGLSFPLLGNLGVDGEIARRYGVFGSQAIFVIDPDGRICWRHVPADGMEVRLDDLTDALRCRIGQRRAAFL
jgi:mycoredoxin-dependent peroxiredoxin